MQPGRWFHDLDLGPNETRKESGQMAVGSVTNSMNTALGVLLPQVHGHGVELSGDETVQ